MGEIKSHKDLLVWQKAVELVVTVYRITSTFPRDELYGLVSQIRRSAVSIPSNIAEGAARQTKREFQQFLHIALGSASELETQFIIAGRLGYCDALQLEAMLREMDQIRRMLLGLIRQLRSGTK